jgi:hypothetical protein
METICLGTLFKALEEGCRTAVALHDVARR